MKKQRLLDLQEKSKDNAELKDIVEIVSELFLSQSQYNKEILNNINALSAKLNKMQIKINEIAKYTTMEPLAQIMIENYEEFQNEKYDEEDDED